MDNNSISNGLGTSVISFLFISQFLREYASWRLDNWAKPYNLPFRSKLMSLTLNFLSAPTCYFHALLDLFSELSITVFKNDAELAHLLS